MDVSPERAQELLVSHARYREIAPLVERNQEELESSDKSSLALSAAANRLHEALTGLVGDMASLDQARVAFVELTGQRDELDHVVQELSLLDQERNTCHVAVSDFDDNVEQLSRRESRLRNRLEAATGETGDIDSLIDAFNAGHSSRSIYEESSLEIASINRRRADTLLGRSPQELEESARNHRRDRDRLLSEHPWLDGAQTSATRDELQAQFRDQTSDLSQLEIEISRLSATISAQQREIRPRAVVEEDLAQCLEEVARLQAFGAELDLAITLVSEAVNETHRQFGPSVGRFMSSGLAQITAGRYRQVWIDPA